MNYTLDKVGNRTNVTDNGVSTAYTPDNINRYTTVGGQPVVSGPEHEVGTYQNNSYKYVSDTYLAQITQGSSNTYTLGYDALGRCVKRTLNGTATTYVYDGHKAILELNGAIVTASNVYGIGIDEIVMRTDSSTSPAKTYYFYQDHEGSVTHVASGSSIVESYRYDAFGAPTIYNGLISQPSTTHLSTSAINNRFLFTGREYQSTFGIYEYRNRAYHPGIGRFMSEDSKGFGAGDYNLFRYCHNDPEDLTDPMGLDAETGAAYQFAREAEKGQDDRNRPSAPPLPSPYEMDHDPIAQAKQRTQVQWQDTGNWNDKNINHHVKPNGTLDTEGGRTTSDISVSPNKDQSVTVTHDLNWWVEDRYKNTDVVTRELQHVHDWRNWEKDGNELNWID